MMYEIKFSPAAEKYFKKLKDKRLKDAFFTALKKIKESPYIGQAQRGDLYPLYGYDLRYAGTSYELAYKIYEESDKLVVIILAGTRENFYKELRQYLN